MSQGDITRFPDPPGQGLLIEVEEGVGMTDHLTALYAQAAGRWLNVITGPALELTVNGTTINGVRIVASVDTVDGAGGFSAMTEFDEEFFRPDGSERTRFLPAKASITLDQQNLQDFMARPESSAVKERFLLDLLTHEMGHALGFSKDVWIPKGLLTTPNGTEQPVFTGPTASKVYSDLRQFSGTTPVPVEGLGADDPYISHWRQFVFTSELMTRTIELGKNEISPVTVAAMFDLGYEVARSGAETMMINFPGAPTDATRPLASGDGGGEDERADSRLPLIRIDCHVRVRGKPRIATISTVSG
jgi:hypothetical protein